MKTKIWLIALITFLVTVLIALPLNLPGSFFQKASAPSFYVQGRHLYTKDREKVILRGVNRMAIWAEPTVSSRVG